MLLLDHIFSPDNVGRKTLFHLPGGGKEKKQNITSSALSFQGNLSLDIFLFPVLLFCHVMRVVLDYLQFLITHQNPAIISYQCVLVSTGSRPV